MVRYYSSRFSNIVATENQYIDNGTRLAFKYVITVYSHLYILQYVSQATLLQQQKRYMGPAEPHAWVVSQGQILLCAVNA